MLTVLKGIETNTPESMLAKPFQCCYKPVTIIGNEADYTRQLSEYALRSNCISLINDIKTSMILSDEGL